MRLATYNIGAIQANSFMGQTQAYFKRKFAADLNILIQNADVICIQEINKYWSDFMRERTGWQTIFEDNKAICWGPGIQNIAYETQRVFPESSAGEARKFRRILWVRRLSNVNILIARFRIRA